MAGVATQGIPDRRGPQIRQPVEHASSSRSNSGRAEKLATGTTPCPRNGSTPSHILLPDVAVDAAMGPHPALKARVEIAEGKSDEAIRTIETGVAFARHVAEGPFLINGLVGIAIANHMLATL